MFISRIQFTTNMVQLVLSHFHKISQQYNARLQKQTTRKMSKLRRLCISAVPGKGLKGLFPFGMSPRKHITVSPATCCSRVTD